MNLNENPTREELATLLYACDDKAAQHMLWVSNDGDVYIEPLPENVSPVLFCSQRKDRMKFRFETYDNENGYVGAGAAADRIHVETLFNQIQRNWESGNTGYIDF